MSRFVQMFHKLAADAETHAPPSPSDVSLSSRVLLHEGSRRLSSFSSPSSIDHSDTLRQTLLRSKIIQRAHDIIDLDRGSAPAWNLPPALPSFSLDGGCTSSKASIEDEQSIAANNEALDRLFGDVFCSPSFYYEERHLEEEVRENEDDLFCSKQAKIRKVEESQSFSYHWDAQLFLPVY